MCRRELRGEIHQSNILFQIGAVRAYTDSPLSYSLCLRPYHVECTGSRPITEVKQRRAWLVLGWVTAWELQVL